MPIHQREKNHWFLLQIRFDITKQRVDSLWYDSLVNINSDRGLELSRFGNNTELISQWLQHRYAQSLGDAAGPDSKLQIESKIGRMQRDQGDNGFDCGIWTCMYASYLTLHLSMDFKAWKWESGSHMNPVRTSLLHCMIKHGEKERAKALCTVEDDELYRPTRRSSRNGTQTESSRNGTRFGLETTLSSSS